MEIPRDLIKQVVLEVREEIVETEWKTISLVAKETGQSRRKIEGSIKARKYRSKMDGGLRMVHMPSFNAYIESCPE